MRRIVEVRLSVPVLYISGLESVCEDHFPRRSGMQITDLSLIYPRGLTFSEVTLWEIEGGNSVSQFGGWSSEAFANLNSVFKSFVPNPHHADREFRHILMRRSIILPPSRWDRRWSKEIATERL